MKYITIREAAKLAGMEYERFRWWVNQGRGPTPYKFLGRLAFIKTEVEKWKPKYLQRGGDRYGNKK